LKPLDPLGRHPAMEEWDVPPGMTYEWKTGSILGEPVSREEFMSFMSDGWTRVPHDRHPGRDVETMGWVLMERNKNDCLSFHDKMVRANDAQTDWARIVGEFGEALPPGFNLVTNPDDFHATHEATEDGWVPIVRRRD